MDASIVITVICDDRPGVVGSLSDVLARHGGSWEESSMLSMAGQFAGILLARLPGEGLDACVAELEALGEKGLQIVVKRSGGAPEAADTRSFSLELVGQDRPGIVRDITRVLAAHGINVQEFETHCQSASMSGETLFFANAKLGVPTDVGVERLQDELEDLANELMVEIRFEE